MSGIPQPHGGALVNGHSKMDVAGMEEIKVSASIQSEIENIADGIFSPLDGFLGQADFESVISSGKLVNGTTWTIPIARFELWMQQRQKMHYSAWSHRYLHAYVA